MNITNPYGPNTTVLLAGSCNAKCDFCFWNRDGAKVRQPFNYVSIVLEAVKALPEEFRVLSISGGEPTLSPYFEEFLSKLGGFRRSRHLDRVVLTTHGGNLLPHIALVGSVVEHINISRHGIGTEENVAIFKTNKIPTDNELMHLISQIRRKTSSDVTFNCVVKPDVTVEWCERYIGYAQLMGANAVSFRKEASDASPTKAEQWFASRYGIDNETECPVCRGMVQHVSGENGKPFQVRWKGSVMEPSIETNGVYEVVIHPDGKAYTDWNMKVPLSMTATEAKKKTIPIKSQPSVILSNRIGGCGSGGCGR